MFPDGDEDAYGELDEWRKEKTDTPEEKPLRLPLFQNKFHISGDWTRASAVTVMQITARALEQPKD